MRIYGLTGGIASGKSTVGRILRELGVQVVDADVLARQVVAPGSDALARIVDRFGETVLDSNGALDRAALGQAVFSDPKARLALEQITHPLIAKAGAEALQKIADEGETLAFYEAALIIEKSLQSDMDALIVVSIPEELQARRLQLRDNLSSVEAHKRIASQAPLSEKLAVADYVINNGGTKAHTEEQVVALWRKLSSN